MESSPAYSTGRVGKGLTMERNIITSATRKVSKAIEREEEGKEGTLKSKLHRELIVELSN